MVAASLLGGLLTEVFSPSGALRAAAWIAAAAPVAVLVCLTLVDEERAGVSLDELRARALAAMATVRSRTLLLIAVFLFCYYFSPGFGTPLYFHMTDTLGFSQGFIGLLSSVSAAGWIAGGLLYRRTLARMDTQRLLRVSILFGTASSLSYLTLADPATAVIVYFVNGIAGMVANIATLTLAAQHCPPRAEGFAFAGLMSVINLSEPLSDTIGALLYEHVFGGWLAPLIVLSAAVTLSVLILLRLMRIDELDHVVPCIRTR